MTEKSKPVRYITESQRWVEVDMDGEPKFFPELHC